MARVATTSPIVLLGLGIAFVAASVYGRGPSRPNALEAHQAAVYSQDGGETGLRL